ncbi:MAG: dephospho-CoA kinase [Candidatus Margulisiibacteriota bacterium]|nr:dephospho-CoA kinase [Candidatus Margulisiibacteriota bacterium]
MIIGLTGPAAAGKNEVAKILKDKGARVIDVDKIGHDLLLTNKALCRELVAVFGSQIEKEDGLIDRSKLSEIVFKDLTKLKQLGQMMHPLMKSEVRKALRRSSGQALGPSADLGASVRRKLVVINAAVLYEMGLVDECDQVWVVMASAKKRLERLVKHRKISKAHAQRIINGQRTKDEYLEIADVVIENEGTLKSLKEKVSGLSKNL